MTTEKLYEFLILSKTLNYSKAAETLYISQSILTRHIQELEKELDTRLFARNTHGVSLTYAGSILAGRAEQLIEKCDNAVSLAHISGLSIMGSVKIACSLELSYAAHLQIFFQRFSGRYPNIQLIFDVKTEGTPADLLLDYDIVFTPCEYTNLSPEIQSQLIARHGIYVVLPPEHPLLSKSLIHMRELSGETLIVPFATEYFGPYAGNLLAVQKHTRGNINYIKTANLPSALFLVASGRGIALAPRYVKNLLPHNAVVTGLSSELCHFNEYIYYHEKKDNGAARLFWEEFRNSIPIQTV